MGILMETTEVNLGTASYRRRAVQPQIFGTMGTPYAETVHTIAINTRETEFGSIVEPIMLKTYKHFQAGNGYRYPQQMVTPVTAVPLVPESPSTSNGVKEEPRDTPMVTRPPPKKKWIKEYLEEEPQSPVAVRAGGPNGVPPPSPPTPAAPPSPAASIDYVQEHSRPRTTSATHGPAQIPSPPSVGSSGSNGSGSSGGARAGTREVHNKLEKNRRAHLKECFELLKRQLPAAPDDKKTSNLSILGSAIRYIQVLRRKERECEHEMERLAREKIAAQQRLAALKRDVPPRAALRTRTHDGASEERDESVNGPVVGIPISITSSPPRVAHLEPSPPHTLNLSTKLRSLPIQITPTTSQMLRTAYAARHNTLTLATLAPADTNTAQNGPVENGVPSALSTALVHPAQIHLPLSQVVGGGGLVVGGALQLLGGAPLRVLQPKRNGMTTVENSRIPKENGLVSPPPATGVVVSGLSPLVVSPGGGAHLLHTHTLAHKMVETQVVKGSPLTVSAQYLSATTIVKPMVVVSSAPSPPAPST